MLSNVMSGTVRRTRTGHGLWMATVVCATLFVGSLRPVGASAPKVSLPTDATYVALGSSYAAGLGIPSQYGACGRSDHNYPHLVAATLHLKLDDVTCSGAVTANVLTSPQGAAPPQIGAVTPDTRLVTITIGGNDVDYIGTAIECGQPQNEQACAQSVDQAAIDAAFRMLPASLVTLIDTVRARAPDAIIVLVTYPRLVPPSSCPALGWSPAATRLLASMGQRLETTFRSVARRTHIRIADPYVLGAAHGPCAPPATRWVAGSVAPAGFPYHPTAAGHVEMARLVEADLGSKG